MPVKLNYIENYIENEIRGWELGRVEWRENELVANGGAGKRYSGGKSHQCPAGLRRKWMYTTFFNFRSTTCFVFTMPWISGNNTWIV